MRLEESVSQAIATGASLGFDAEDGEATCGFEAFWGESAFPPPGYLPWDVLEVGNGDTYGFYWPIGKEDQPPLVCTLMHDAKTLFPLASNFERALRLLRATDIADEDEFKELAKDFKVKLTRLPKLEPDEKVPFYGMRASDLLKIDDRSPSILLAAARELRGKDLPGAEKLARQAVEILPEYAEGWEFLANLHRQGQKQLAVVDNTLRAIGTPMAFGAKDRKKLLAPLKKLLDHSAPNPNDPIWKRRAGLTFAEDAKESADARLLTEAIGDYHRQGQHLRALYLRLVLGEWIAGQTVSFQLRLNWNWPQFHALLRNDHEHAGLTARLPALAG